MTLVQFVAWSLTGLVAVTVPAAEDAGIKVMSFNIRYGTAKDGENHWDKRKDFLAATIKVFNPDLLGTQETLGFQRDFLAAKLPGFGVFGVGRDDGKEKGEMMAVYWRKDRFEKQDGGHFWLSERPGTPGSKSWDTSLPRMATWVKLKETRKPDAKPVLFMNTHFDHMGKKARLESAKLIRERIATLGKDCSVILTGDFNAGEGSEPYKALFDAAGKDDSPVMDSLRTFCPKKEADEGTITAFKAGANNSSRIDWIGVSRDWQVVEAGIDRTEKNGRTPSDHFPVTARLRR
ncbi:MAG: endonuclease/exonuclease/phosphatase family protein [Gemmataceae bacterium]